MTGAGRAALAQTEFPAVQRVLGERVRRLRAERGLSQRGLAEGAGVHERHVQRVEAGASNLRVSTVALLARALGTTVGEMVGVSEGSEPA